MLPGVGTTEAPTQTRVKDRKKRRRTVSIGRRAPAEGFGDEVSAHGSSPASEARRAAVETVPGLIEDEAEAAGVVFVARDEVATLLAPGGIRTGADFSPPKRGTLPLMFGILMHAGTKGGLVVELAAMAIEVGACPLLHRPMQPPGGREIEAAMGAGHHGEGVVADLGDEKIVVGPGTRCGLIVSDLVEHCAGIAMGGKPGFRGGAIVGEMKEFGAFASVIENTNHSRLRALDDGEPQRRIDRKRLEHLEHHNAGAAEVALVQRDARRFV
jgi:hypothetical protein